MRFPPSLAQKSRAPNPSAAQPAPTSCRSSALTQALGLLCLLVHGAAPAALAQRPSTPAQDPAAAAAAAASQRAPGGKNAGTGQHPDQPAETKEAVGQPGAPSPIAPSVPPPGPVGRPRIGLALGGGGALALSEIGTLQWFEEHHIPVDVIAGTSMGCMVAALYSIGTPIDRLKVVMNDRVFNQVFRFDSTYSSRSFRRRQDTRELPNGITVGLRHGVSFRNSVLTDQGLNAFLDRRFLRYDDRVDFNTLPIPLRCMSTDLTTSQSVTFARGSLPDAVRASVSLPGVYQPFQMAGHEFVDGGVLVNLPTATVKQMNADVVLAVSLPLQPVVGGDLGSILGVLQRSFSVAIEGAEREQRKLADVVMMPNLDGFTATDYLRASDLAQRGYQAAEAQRDKLLPYAISEEQWQQYLDRRSGKLRAEPGSILRVEVRAPGAEVTTAIQHKFARLIDAPPNTSQIEALLDEVRSDGRYDADYVVTYPPAAQPASSADTLPAANGNRPTLVVTVAEKKTGPPFLLLGANVLAQTGGVTRATLEGILVHQDLGGYGSEFRANIKVGFETVVDAEYQRHLSGTSHEASFFVVPHGSFRREPFYIFQNQNRIAERLLERTGGGADLGWSDARFQELRLGYEANHVQWLTEVGSDAQPEIHGTAQRVRLRYIYDSQDRALVPQFGIRSTTEASYLFNAVASPNAPQIRTDLVFSHQIGKNLFVFSTEGGTTFNRNVAQPFRFTLGGPLRLTASAIDEFRGTDYFYLSPAFLRRVARLPDPLGQSIYLGISYEAGQMHAPGLRTVTRQDVYFGIVAETPLGVVTVAPAIGDDGHRKFVFTLGKLF